MYTLFYPSKPNLFAKINLPIFSKKNSPNVINNYNIWYKFPNKLGFVLTNLREMLKRLTKWIVAGEAGFHGLRRQQQQQHQHQHQNRSLGCKCSNGLMNIVSANGSLLSKLDHLLICKRRAASFFAAPSPKLLNHPDDWSISVERRNAIERLESVGWGCALPPLEPGM